MRVAYVCADPGVPVFGRKGAAVHVQEVVRVLRRRGAEVTLHAARVGGPAPEGLQDIAVTEHAVARRGAAGERERRARRASARLGVVLAAGGPVDLLYERYSLWSHTALTWAAAAGVPSVCEVNAPLISEQARHRTLVDRAAAERSARIAFEAATVVVAVSPAVARWVRGVAPGAAVHVVGNGVDIARFDVSVARRETRRDPGVLTVGFVGSLKPWHDVGLLVAALRRLADLDRGYRLLIVGDGPQRAAVETAVCDAGLAPITTFTGAVEPARVPSLLAAMDVAVAPYPPGAADDVYFSPLKVFEYLAAECAVVASRSGQVPGLVEDGRTGLLVQPGDAAALAGAIEALRRDPRGRAAMGQAGRRHVASHHTWDRVVDRILGLAGVAGPRERVA